MEMYTTDIELTLAVGCNTAARSRWVEGTGWDHGYDLLAHHSHKRALQIATLITSAVTSQLSTEIQLLQSTSHSHERKTTSHLQREKRWTWPSHTFMVGPLLSTGVLSDDTHTNNFLVEADRKTVQSDDMDHPTVWRFMDRLRAVQKKPRFYLRPVSVKA